MNISFSAPSLESSRSVLSLIDAPQPHKPAFLITVDTECDDAWACSRKVTTRNAAFLPRFQAVCERFGFTPTYFTTYEMAISPVFREFGQDLLSRGTAEIGMHVHAWDSPPIVPLTCDDAAYHPYLIEYPESVMRDKIAFLTDLLEDAFSTKMLSHRAGRWGFNEVYARLLIKRGYLADCSVTPLHSWKQHPGDPAQDGGSDYSHFPLLPYFVDLDDISRPGNSPLLEIPVTAMELRSPALRTLQRKLPNRSLANRALNRAFPPRCLLALTGRNIPLMIRVLEKSVQAGRPCVQFALHSSNLMPNGSPFFPEESDVEALYDDLHRLFSVAARHLRPATVTQFHRQFVEAPSAYAA